MPIILPAKSGSRKRERKGLAVGFAYWHPWLYRALMLGAYRTNFFRRNDAILGEIPAGSSVVDLCCGDATLGLALQAKGCAYIGLDINPRFVEWGKRRGLDIREWDARRDEIPEADVLCLQASLYQFMPDEKVLIEKMLEKARCLVLLAEPVVNLSSHPWAMLQKLAINWTKVGDRSFPLRHDRHSFIELIRSYGAELISIAGGREILAVIRKRPL